MIFIKTKIFISIRSSLDQYDNVRVLLKVINEQFKSSDKALAINLIMRFSFMKFISMRGVHEHIMKMRDSATQLKKFKLKMSESFLMHYILNTLLYQYEPFKISYNTYKEINA